MIMFKKNKKVKVDECDLFLLHNAIHARIDEVLLVNAESGIDSNSDPELKRLAILHDKIVRYTRYV